MIQNLEVEFRTIYLKKGLLSEKRKEFEIIFCSSTVKYTAFFGEGVKNILEVSERSIKVFLTKYRMSGFKKREGS